MHIELVARTIYCPGGGAKRSHKKPPKTYIIFWAASRAKSQYQADAAESQSRGSKEEQILQLNRKLYIEPCEGLAMAEILPSDTVA